MQTGNVLALLLLAFLAGYWVALLQTKWMLKKEMQAALDAVEREEEARLQ